MPDGDIRDQRSLSTEELTQIVRAFADSDLRELRLQVGDVDLLVSRNEHVDGAAPAARPAAPPAASATTPAAPPAPAVHAHATAAPVAGAVPAAPASTGDRIGLVAVRSPAVGVFYRRPAPDKSPYAEVGSTVAVGDPVGNIEVMKMFTTVTTEVAGTVAEICVEDATLVEYDQVIMYLTPAGGA